MSSGKISSNSYLMIDRLRMVWTGLNMGLAFILLAPIDVLMSFLLRRRPPWFFTWLWSRWVFLMGGIRFRVEGKENLVAGEKYVFMSNHTHEADIALLYMALKRDIVFVSKRELSKVPFAGWYAALKGHIFIERSNPTGAQYSMMRAAEKLKRRLRSVVIFPEGTYFKDGYIRPFRPGGAVLAMQTGMRIVPVAIHTRANIEEMLIKGTWKNPLRIIIGKPFSVMEKGYEDRYDVAKKARETVLALIKRTAPSTSKR